MLLDDELWLTKFRIVLNEIGELSKLFFLNKVFCIFNFTKKKKTVQVKVSNRTAGRE